MIGLSWVKSCNEYASIEEVPEEMERSSLQRVVQILKAHRNNYFSSSKREKMKPKSVIITTLVAEISSHLDANLGTFELLDKVLKELDIYSNRQIFTESVFKSNFGLHTAITRPEISVMDGGKCILQVRALRHGTVQNRLWNPSFYFHVF